MPLIRNGRFIDDDWRDAGAPEIAADHVVATLRRNEQRGIVVAADGDATTLQPRLAGLELVVILFAATGDGRGLSLAHLLRRGGFEGELRARGELLPDQYHDLRGCGFDSVEISDELAARHGELEWHKAWRRFDRGYQQRAGRRGSILTRRHRAAAAQTTP